MLRWQQKVISTSGRAISLIYGYSGFARAAESAQALRMYVDYYKNAIIRAFTRTFA